MDVPTLQLECTDLVSKVSDILAPLIIDADRLEKTVKVFEDELDKGLASGLSQSSLLMENTFIPELLNGEENGRFLALDLGGTNFRVILLELEKGKIKNEIIDYYSVEESLRFVLLNSNLSVLLKQHCSDLDLE